MKHRLMIAALLAASSVMAQGGKPQGPGNPPMAGQMADRQLQRLTTLLDLTAAQQQQAKTIFSDEATASQALFPKLRDASTALQNAVKNTGLDADIESAATQIGTLQGQMAAIHAKAQAKFRGILTADQKTKLDSLHGPGGMGRGPMGGGPGPMGPGGHGRPF